MHPLRKHNITPIQNLPHSQGATGSPLKRQKILTPREIEIVRLVVRGMTNKEIALALDISHWTVATHLRRIYDKTSVKRRAALSHALFIV